MLTVAVLKSPRNNRKKSKWKIEYARSNRSTPINLSDRKNPKAIHRLYVFLRDRTHSVATSLRYIPEPTVRPNTMLIYGRNSFDSTSTHPLVFRKKLRSAKLRKRLFTSISLASSRSAL